MTTEQINRMEQLWAQDCLTPNEARELVRLQNLSGDGEWDCEPPEPEMPSPYCPACGDELDCDTADSGGCNNPECVRA